ncbi:hypothetical protein A2U01_0077958, partial [Trifolium medium]|nr:hypothetical protein [Trifolium medium]
RLSPLATFRLSLCFTVFALHGSRRLNRLRLSIFCLSDSPPQQHLSLSYPPGRDGATLKRVGAQACTKV